MGILSEILAGKNPASKKTDPEKKSEPQNIKPSTPATPTAPCEICKPPYGRHFWSDPYGCWHCTQCNPPASLAMVRDQMLLAADGSPDVTVISPDGSTRINAGEEFPAYARGRWRFFEDRHGYHFERLSFE